MTHPLKGRARLPAGQPTLKQLAVLHFLAAHQAKTGASAKLMDISAHFGWRSHAAALPHLDGLTGLGLVARPQRQRQGLKLTEAGKALVAKAERGQAIRAAVERRKEAAL